MHRAPFADGGAQTLLKGKYAMPIADTSQTAAIMPRPHVAIDVATPATTTDDATPISRLGSGSDTEFVGAAAAPTPDDMTARSYAAVAQPTAPAATPGAAWNASWEQRFEALRLAPEDIAYLRTAGYDDATLEQIAQQLAQVDIGTDATPSTASTQAPQQVVDTTTPAQTGATPSGWNAEWESKFSLLLHAMGRPEAEIQQQLQEAASGGLSTEQLQTAYDGMRAALGDFTPAWKAKFSALMTELGATAEQQEQSLQQLASSGMTTAKLQEAYAALTASKPGWNAAWDQKFRALDLPDDALQSIQQAKGSDADLTAQYDRLAGIRKQYADDGRLKRLEDADATPAEKWGVMTQGTSGKDFDKVVDQIHSSHVPLWKRIVSFGVNLIPGAFALEYLGGGDPITGEKIDRTNPLNIIGFVASGFSAFTAIRGAVGVIQGLTAANAAVKATQAAAGVANISQAVAAAGTASKIGAGTLQAIEGAGLVTKLSAGLKIGDYVKAVLPVVNKFGEAKALAQFGAGYSQAMQFAAGTAALTKTASGVVIDQGIKSTVLDTMRSGGSVSDALAKVQRSAHGAMPMFSNAEVTKLAGSTGFMQDVSLWNLNPFKNQSTVALKSSENGVHVAQLGRAVNLGSKSGMAQAIGNIKAWNVTGAATPEGLRAAAQGAALRAGLPFAGGMNRDTLAAVKAANQASVGANGLETTLVSKWATRLGVDRAGGFRSLAQLGASNRAASSAIRTVENTGNGARNLASWIAGMPGRDRFIIPGVMTGVATGSMGHQLQGVWEAVQDDPGVVVGQSKHAADTARARTAAQAEQQRLAAEYATEHATSPSQPIGAAPVTQ